MKDRILYSDNNRYELFKPLRDKAIPSAPFLSMKTRDLIHGYFKDEERTSSFLESIENLRDVWRKILIDAIHFLRMADNREGIFSEVTATNNRISDKASEAALDNVYGVKELFEYFKQFSNFESTLYGADQYYRDHLHHPFKVWLIGVHILEEFGSKFHTNVGGEYIAIDAGNESKKKEKGSSETNKDKPLILSLAELKAMWAITALTHDLGYPLEKVEKINDQLEKMLSKFGKIGFFRSRFSFDTQHDHLVRFLLKLISSAIHCTENGDWLTRLRTKYHTKFSKSWEMFDHGIVSSLIMLKTLTFFIESDLASDIIKPLAAEDARQFAIRSEILHAIASHTTPKIYHLTASNLAFLLVLCDELQEWSRPTMSDMRTGNRKGNADEVVIEKYSVDEKNNHDIQCRIHYDAPSHGPEQTKFVLRIFKSWHERLRPAVDTKNRTINFIWEIGFGKSPSTWKFDLNNSRPPFEQIKFWGPIDSESNPRPFSLYEELEKIEKQGML